jgi:hypothetical protein
MPPAEDGKAQAMNSSNNGAYMVSVMLFGCGGGGLLGVAAVGRGGPKGCVGNYWPIQS